MLSYCGQQARRYDKDRFFCSLFTPGDKREGLFTLLAFNQEVAGIGERVTESLPGLIRLQWWREALDGIYKDDPRNHEVVRALHHLVKGQGLSRSLLDAMIDAREQDLDTASPPTLQSLLDYAEKTSGNLHHLMVEALGTKDQALLEAAKQIGIAWALTGMLRAMKFRANKRVMLPEDALKEHHVTADDVKAGKHLDAVRPVVKMLVEMVERYVAGARQCRVPKDTLGVFLPATMVDIQLKSIRRAGYDLFTSPLEVHPTLIHAKVSFRAWRGRF